MSAAQVVSSVNGPDRENSTFLPGHRCPDNLKATTNICEAVTGSQLVLMVVPTPYIAATVKPIMGQLQPDQIFVSCTKVDINVLTRSQHSDQPAGAPSSGPLGPIMMCVTRC